MGSGNGASPHAGAVEENAGGGIAPACDLAAHAGGVDEQCLAAVAWPASPHAPTVLVPLGSTGRSGTCLPPQTDTVISTAVARATAARLRRVCPEESVVVAPAIAYGAGDDHLGARPGSDGDARANFPGVMSIGTDTLQLLLVELIRSLSRWAGRTVIINGCDGNLDAVAAAVVQSRHEGRDAAWVPCTAENGDLPAGHVTTSLMLHLAPGLVSPVEARPMSRRSSGDVAVLGNHATATAEDGRRLLGRIAGDLAARIRSGRVCHTGRLLEADGDAAPVPHRPGVRPHVTRK
ncbi:creatininase family protein [Microbispora hainanensis]|uniref:creatininase family protein n=1 Tax=Microbispora hainanensis TaxID=568844 RepID=UPI002E2BFEA6|nr:creatininase family protein [Microbispora hainanensis]